jgi:NitT/TauT family transport system substrate-binding protein
MPLLSINRRLSTLILAALALIIGGFGAARAAPDVRVGTLQFGTVNWELGVIGGGIDQKHGFTLKPVVLADKDATSVALLSGDVDAIVTDWIWVAKQRSLGRDFTFVPFSRSVGALMVDPAKGYKKLSDLKGKSLGIAGGATDKSWVLLQAYARKTEALDVAKAIDVQFAAPPMLNELMMRGKLDGVLNFWNFNARLKEKGMVPLITIGEILPTLGLKTSPPLLGWVFSEKWAKDHPELAKGLIDASYEAKQAMKNDDGLWLKLRPKMDADSDSLFEILKAGYREGIPESYTEADVAAASDAFDLMRGIDPAAVGGLDKLPPGTFFPAYRP